MAYVILFILALLIAALLLRIRVRFTWDEKERSVFFGLGRTGQVLDFRGRTGQVHVCGITVSRFELDPDRPHIPFRGVARSVGKLRPKKLRRIDWSLLRETVPIVSHEFRSFTRGLWRALIIEDLHANVRAGFETPDLTGAAFGYYQAALGMAPGVVGRIRFTPDWTGASLAASARACLAVPLYKLLWRIAVLLWRLPWRNLKKLSIGHKEGRT